MKSVYLDYAAATPMDARVTRAMQPYFSEQFYNPSATYLAAKSIAQDVQHARASVAGILGVRPAEIIFTAGGTEANNLAILGVAESFPASHIVTTALEHDSVRAPIARLKQQGWTATEVKPKPDGLVDALAITGAVTDKTVLVSVMQANNEIGTIQPIGEITRELELIKNRRRAAGNKTPLYLHTDACQAANYLDLHAHRLGVDLMTLNGGKIYGPKQSGVLFVASRVRLAPQVHGGGQELNKRSGTENVAAIMGFAKALEIAQNMRREESNRLSVLQKQFIELLKSEIPQANVNGSLNHRLPNNVHITIPNADNERLIFALDDLGVQCAAGSACSASKEESSHVLRSLGLTDEDARASLRFSMGRGTTQDEIAKTVKALAKIID